MVMVAAAEQILALCWPLFVLLAKEEKDFWRLLFPRHKRLKECD